MMQADSALPSSSFSYYLAPRDYGLVRECALQADAVVLAGSRGPAHVRQLRSVGWEARVMFDRTRYLQPGREVDQPAWIAIQRDACANTLLTYGRLVNWSDTRGYFSSVVSADLELARANNVTAVLALDHRWLTRASSEVIDVLGACDAPVALVLVNSNDPLSVGGAVSGLLAMLRHHKKVSLLRCDSSLS